MGLEYLSGRVEPYQLAIGFAGAKNEVEKVQLRSKDNEVEEKVPDIRASHDNGVRWRPINVGTVCYCGAKV